VNLWDVLVSIFWFMLLVAWFWLLIVIIGDLFRDDGLSGLAKAAWCIYLIVLPWLGVLTYLLVRGKSMGERSAREAARNERAFRSYVRDAAGSGSGVADELTRLRQMRDEGHLTPQEYEQAKSKVIGSAPAPAAAAPTSNATAGTPSDLPV